MKKKKVVIIGGTGMLGCMLVDVLSKNENLNVYASFRVDSGMLDWSPSGVKWLSFYCREFLPPALELGPEDWIINAAGMIKHRIDESCWRSVEAAVSANSVLPFMLAGFAERFGARVIQIATDCVFSGDQEGGSFSPYFEGDAHDARDVYGKTKSLGEVRADWFHNIRCSIIGPEARNKLGLLEWFLSNPAGSSVNGFDNHWWNGVTTFAYAKLVEAIVVEGMALPNDVHMVPAGTASKYDLLCLFRKYFKREDIIVNPVSATPVCRVLGTNESKLNETLWRKAGYEGAPTIETMVSELAALECGFK